MSKVIPFQIRLIEEINREIKVSAAYTGMTKHEWIERAIAEKIEREMKGGEKQNERANIV